MNIVDQQTHQQISDLIKACDGYWELRGIAAERRNEMRSELEEHLRLAVRDGKSLEAVVGPNALSFAESWTRETPHRFSGGFTLILRWFAFGWLPYALMLLCLIVIPEHLLSFSSAFAFTLNHGILSMVLIGLFTALQGLSGFLTPRIPSREKRILLVFGVYALISLPIILALYQVKAMDAVLFYWQWPLTVLLIVATIALFILKPRQQHANVAV